MSELAGKPIDHATGTVRQDEEGREIPDSTPLELPLGMKRPDTLAEQVQRLVRRQLSDYAALHGHESFEEAEDFDVDEDFDPSTPYEEEFDPILGKNLTPADFLDPERRDYLKEQYLQAERNAIRAQARQEAIDEAYKAAKKSGVKGREAPSVAPKGPKDPPAEPS